MKNKKQKPNTHLTAIVRKRRTPKSRAAVRQSFYIRSIDCVAV